MRVCEEVRGKVFPSVSRLGWAECSESVGDAVMTGIFALTHLMACDGEERRSRCAEHCVDRYPHLCLEVGAFCICGCV